MLIQDLVVEAGVSNGETSKLPSVAIWVLAARDCSFDQAMLQELLVEVASMSAQVTDQVAYFGPNSRILVANERVQVDINVSVVNRFVEFFRDSR